MDHFTALVPTIPLQSHRLAILYLGIGTVTIEADNGEYSTVQPILEALLSFSE